MANPKNSNQPVYLFGNLGDNPKVHETAETSGTYQVYDPIIDEVAEREYTRQAGEFRTFSVAVQAEGMEQPRWIHCVDWDNLSRLCRKGDRVKLSGHFETRTYTSKKDGEEKTAKQFVVESLSIERTKVRTQAA